MVQSYLSKIVAANILPAVYFGLCGTPHLNNVPGAADCKIVWLCESNRLISQKVVIIVGGLYCHTGGTWTCYHREWDQCD
jgi:hypothetical protein